MYIPKAFVNQNPDLVKKIIIENSFATVITQSSSDAMKLPTINHFPIIFDKQDQQKNTLLGHMAKRNLQWQEMKASKNGMILFQGPHTYITPKWYKSGRDVPTWNYAMIHVSGLFEVVEEFEGLVNIVKQLTQFYEGDSPTAWAFELPSDLQDQVALTGAIVGFKFHIHKIDAKFKLSQNRSVQDRNGIIEGLSERADENSALIKALMLNI